ncbi:porin family protein [Pseudogemmobacter faecipullorum]|uniref:Porin n=1 Tax=Pseudogemmobacter faecipullorum TaxID=2755041 RepID=A0ABS8CI23_9RHOB|nr:porin family protein [Pseudogemmobacter faecipullorum]MCB5409038.1 hypothetical protein [Pseudogemmobacter faecipullorum]
MKIRTLAATVALMLPVPALAQNFSGAVTLGYGLGEISDLSQDINSLTFNGSVNVQLGSGFSLGVRADYGAIDVKGLGVDIGANLLGANVAYQFDNGGWVGAYTENAEISVDLLPINFGVTDFGVEGGYRFSGVDLSGFVGKSTDITSFGIAGKYEADGALLGASAMRSNVKFGGADLGVTAAGLAGAYNFSQGWGVFAGAGRTSLSEVDADLTTVGLGGSYAFEAAATPVVVSLELARTKLEVGGLGSTDLDTVRLGVTVPFGNKGSVLPKNSVADAILNPGHTAISQTVLMAF